MFNNNNNNNNMLSKGENLKYQKNQLNQKLKNLQIKHRPGKTWDIWREIVDTKISIEKLEIKISENKIDTLRKSLIAYNHKLID